MKNEPFEINENSEKRYMKGKINFLFRLQYFMNEGLSQINNGRNILYSLFLLAGYLGYKEGNITLSLVLLLIGVALGALTIAILLGWIFILRGKKSVDYFIWRDASPIGKWQTQMQQTQMSCQEQQVEQNNKIIELLEKIYEQRK